MAKKRKLRQELSKFARKTEKPPEIISGALGIFIGGKQYVDVPTRAGYVFVRLRNNMSELIQAHNQTVSPIYDLPVLVVWNHNRYEIYGRDSEQYGSYWDTSSSFLPKHGFQHEFDPDNNGGGDLVFVHGEQFYPMMTFPSGTDGANTVLIAPYRYFYQGLWRYTGNTGVGDLLALGPTGGNNAKLLLVGVTSATGNPFIKQGDEFSEGITGAAALTQFVPTSLTPIDEIPGAIIRLVTGTETITWANIYDARQYMGILQAGSGTAGASTFLGLSDTPNSYSGQANKLLVVNSAENAVEFRTNTGSFGGGGGGQIGIYGQDEAVGLGTGTVLNVTGDNVSLSISGTILTLAHANPTGTPHSFLDLTDTPDSYSGQGGKFVAVNTGTTGLEFISSTITQVNSTGIMAWDEGVPLGTGTVFNFRGDNIVATISGTVVDVYVTGSGGSDLNVLDPYGIHHRLSGLHADDDEFSVNSTGSYTSVVPTGNANWVGANGVLNCIFSGQSANDIACMLKAMTLADGEWFETTLRIFNKKLTNFCMGGIVLTDGTAVTSRAIALMCYLSATSGNLNIELWTGTVTNMLAASGAGYIADAGSLVGKVRLRLLRNSATSFALVVGMEDGAQYNSFGAAAINPGFTPTHAGLLASVWGGAQTSMISYDYIRHMS